MEQKPLWLDQINSIRWLELCDYAYLGNDEPFVKSQFEALEGKLKLFRHPDELGNSGVIFCGTTQLIKECLQSIPETGNYILITRDNDQSVTDELFNIRPQSIKHWFAINCAVTHPDITAIPVGCNTLGGDNQNLILVAEEFNRKQQTEKLIYARYNIPNEMVYPHERHRCTSILEKNPLVTINYNQIPAFDMYKQMMFHPFVACPSGTGADTLRLSEALTLGAIPIATDCPELRNLKHLPILFTKDWIFDKDHLRYDLIEKAGLIKYTEPIRMSYWIEQLNEKRKLIA